MNAESRNPKPLHSTFGFRASFVIGYFVIRHSFAFSPNSFDLIPIRSKNSGKDSRV